jgi:hypothetical protein
MIDPVCDPTPSANTNFGDHDGDVYYNAGDNCPLTSNGSQAQAEMTAKSIDSAPDAGPKSDYIGDPCDSEFGGHDAVANGAYIHDMNTAAVCIGGTDTSPANGFCDSGGLSASSIDTDDDNYENFKENYMQTDPLVDCPQVVSKHDAWPPDFNMSRSINILDIVQLTPPVFNSAPPNPNYSKRKDLTADGSINILDIVLLTPPAFNANCTP